MADLIDAAEVFHCLFRYLQSALKVLFHGSPTGCANQGCIGAIPVTDGQIHGLVLYLLFPFANQNSVGIASDVPGEDRLEEAPVKLLFLRRIAVKHIGTGEVEVEDLIDGGGGQPDSHIELAVGVCNERPGQKVLDILRSDIISSEDGALVVYSKAMPIIEKGSKLCHLTQFLERFAAADYILVVHSS